MKTKAYAKINLTLDVFEKTNGLHLLDTVIAPVNLSDDVEVNFFEDTEVTCTLIRCSFPTVWLNASMRSLSGESV